MPTNLAYGALLAAPVGAVNNAGVIYVAGVATDNTLYLTRGSRDSFEPWVPLYGAVRMQGEESSPSIGVNADGRVEIFAHGTDGRTYHSWEACAGCKQFSPFQYLTDQAKEAVTVARNADGRLEIFATTHGNEIDHMWQVTPGGFWSSWGPLPAASTSST